MSPKAFRLVDELKTNPRAKSTPAVKDTAPIKTPSPCVEPTVWAETAEAQAHLMTVPEPSSGGSRIIAITPMDGGEWVSVTLTEGKQRRHVRLLTEQYATLKPSVGDVPTELAEALDAAGKLCDAVRKGMELLGYGAVSHRRLVQKLTVRGFDKETAEAAADYLKDHGWLPETDDAVRFAEQGARKLWGPRRIREDLFARGFPSEVVTAAMESLEDVDFTDNCARVIAKKYGGTPDDGMERKKMVAALMRLGYTSEQIREAMR